jgi:hypothetical protein
MLEVESYRNWNLMEPLPEEIEAAKAVETAAKKERKLRLPRPPLKDVPSREPHRPLLIRLLRSPLQLTLAVLALTPVVIIAEAAEFKFAGEIKVAFICVIVALIFYYMAYALWTAAGAWFTTQKRLSELLAALLFGAAVVTVMQRLSPDPALDLGRHLFLAFGWSAIGATWAWDRMRVLGVDRQSSRLWLLVCGWLAVPGVMGAAFFMLATVILVLEQFGSRGLPDLRIWLIWYGSSVCVSLAAWPAWRVEMRLREKRKVDGKQKAGKGKGIEN